MHAQTPAGDLLSASAATTCRVASSTLIGTRLSKTVVLIVGFIHISITLLH
jgi:hypothetical protein